MEMNYADLVIGIVAGVGLTILALLFWLSLDDGGEDDSYGG